MIDRSIHIGDMVWVISGGKLQQSEVTRIDREGVRFGADGQGRRPWDEIGKTPEELKGKLVTQLEDVHTRELRRIYAMFADES
jgi:hypothetical protein